MAITRSGTSYDSLVDGISASSLRPSGAQSITSVTIPAAQQFAIISFAFHNGSSGQHPTSVTLDGQTASLIVAADSNVATEQTALYFVTGFSSGSGKTIAWTNPATMDDGVSVDIAFYTGGNLTSGVASLVRSSAAAANATHAVTGTLTAQSGDVIVQSWYSDTTTVTLDHGSQINGFGGVVGIGDYSPTGNTTMGATGTDVGFAAAVLIPAGSTITVTIGQPSETDTAQAMTHAKTLTMGQPSEADSAQPMVPNGSSVFLNAAHSRELKNHAGVAWASVTGWQYAWYDSLATLLAGGTPQGTGTFNTNSSGEARVEIPGTTLAAGQTGYLVLKHPNYPTTAVLGLLAVPIGP